MIRVKVKRKVRDYEDIANIFFAPKRIDGVGLGYKCLSIKPIVKKYYIIKANIKSRLWNVCKFIKNT